MISSDKVDRTTSLIVGGVLLLFVCFGMLLWFADLFKFEGTEASAKVLSATIALVGAFGTSAFALIGVMLKHAIDLRTDERLRLESERNDVGRRESENRLKLEASIRAVQLLSTPSGQPAPPAQIVGALLTLINLEQYDLVAELAEEFLRQEQLECGTVAGLLDPIINKGNEEQQSTVIGIIYRHESEFVNSDGFLELPSCFFSSCNHLSLYARTWIPVFVARAILKRQVAYWQTDKRFLYGLIAALGFQFQSELDRELKSEIGAILAAFLKIFPDLRMAYVAAGTLNLDNLRSVVGEMTPHLSAAVETVERITQWSSVPRGAA